jgi:adenine-specific DNA-methyltransferase
MQVKLLKPGDVLNKAYHKAKPTRSEIDRFKVQLRILLESLNPQESEENAKNHIIQFLKESHYRDLHHINTKERIDLVIHTGKNAQTPAAVLIEAKRPGNETEMFAPDNPAAKSMLELLRYYLHERIDLNNQDLRHMVITNGWQWYIFDAAVFDRVFFSRSKLKQDYSEWRKGQKAGNKTEFFHSSIAKQLILMEDDELPVLTLDLRDVRNALYSDTPGDERRIALLYKLLSPVHLLKESYGNDSNTLNEDFYAELLHILGLEEAKVTGKKVIRRYGEDRRLPGSLLENTLLGIRARSSIDRIVLPGQYGDTEEQISFAVGLELIITWINRVLFLKLLESQLLGYHGGDRSYRFLDPEAISDFSDLYKLFFMVLAKRDAERESVVKARFAHVPYLNSSLFEATPLENQAFSIDSLDNQLKLPLYSRTVLRDEKGRRRKGELRTLDYLLRFLDAYDFASEGGEEIQEENKSLINASVLGLIFEKINGYRDGSFFTPGFVTMYMCRETLRKAVVKRFNAEYHWQAQSFDELHDHLEGGKDKLFAYNALINDLRICDPAVGSGHFLVSALNELLAIKSDLRILMDRSGRRIRDYRIWVENDELVVYSDEADDFLLYRIGTGGKPNPELQAVQEAIFHEKQLLIERCLFGVDLNPNSVKICRLRLWIELLKNAYYTVESGYIALETLPNIDINIKQGNSLVSRFGLDADIQAALAKSKLSIADYQQAVQTYHNAENKAQKAAMERQIEQIKGDFRTEFSNNDPLIKRIKLVGGELQKLTGQISIFTPSAKEKKAHRDKVKKLNASLSSLEAEVEAIKNNRLYINAFEWRFEFPEVLDSAGGFRGFDVVIANPPYIRQEEIGEFRPHFAKGFEVYTPKADLYVYFVELGMRICKDGGELCYIIPNKWMRAEYGMRMRQWLLTYAIDSIIDFGGLPVFAEATTYPCILSAAKAPARGSLMASTIPNLAFSDLGTCVQEQARRVVTQTLRPDGWSLTSTEVTGIMDKIRSKGTPLRALIDGKIYNGIKSGRNDAFVLSRAERDKLVAADPESDKMIKPFLAGREIKRFQVQSSDRHLILFPSGWTLQNLAPRQDPWEMVQQRFPAIAKHLAPHEAAGKKRSDQGQYWWELRSCDYYGEFEQVKIFYPDISHQTNFALDFTGKYYSANTTYFFRVTQGEEHLFLGVLNSKLITFVYASMSPAIQGGYLRFFTQYVEHLPILLPTDLQVAARMRTLVAEILAAKASNPSADTLAREAEIDQLVYALYGLDADEIARVEASLRGT